MCWSLFFNKVADISPDIQRRCFPVNFAKFLRTPFLIEHFPWLLLSLHKQIRADRTVVNSFVTDAVII